MNPTRDEVMRITNQMEEALSLEISPLQLLELARFAGLEPNYSGMSVGFQALQDLRDEAHEHLTITEARLPESLDRWTAPEPEEAPQVPGNFFRGLGFAFLFTAGLAFVVWFSIWGWRLL